jgi:branched-subunit amino acid transport protein AzlD
MVNNLAYMTGVIAITALVTWLTRALPFLIFGKRRLPQTIEYLGKVLPSAIMVILVFYCVRNINLTQYPYGMAEIISSIAVILTQMWRKNKYLAIIVGTVCYMILIRTVF